MHGAWREGGHVSSRPAEDRDSMMLPPPSLFPDRAGSMKRINHETQRDEREDHAGIKSRAAAMSKNPESIQI